MVSRKFTCKMEEVPVLAGFIIESLIEDLEDFQRFSPHYNAEFIQSFKELRGRCVGMIKPGVIQKRLKYVTDELVKKQYELRLPLNNLEGYIRRAVGSLDIDPDAFGIRQLRYDINRRNAEGVISGVSLVHINAVRNMSALESQGMKQSLLDSLCTKVQEIDAINNQQNDLLNKRIQTTNEITEAYNLLWTMLTSVCRDARAIYKGVNEVKLKRYIISLLMRRMNSQGSHKMDEDI